MSSLDFLTFPENLRFNVKSTYKTLFGGIISLFIIVIITISSINLFFDFIYRKESKYIYSKNKITNHQSINLNKNIFKVFFGFQNKNSSNFMIDETLFKITAYQIEHKINKVKQNNNIFEFIKRQLNVVNCNTIYTNNEIRNFEMSFSFENLICINSTYSKIGRNQENSNYETIEVHFSKCKNETLAENERRCKSKDEINKIIKNSYFNIFSSDVIVDEKLYDAPIKYIIKKFTQKLSLNYLLNVNLNMNRLILFDENGLIYEDIITKDYLKINNFEKFSEAIENENEDFTEKLISNNENYEDNIFDEKFAVLEIAMEDFYEEIFRTNPKLLEFICLIGGFFNFIYLFKVIFNYIFSKPLKLIHLIIKNHPNSLNYAIHSDIDNIKNKSNIDFKSVISKKYKKNITLKEQKFSGENINNCLRTDKHTNNLIYDFNERIEKKNCTNFDMNTFSNFKKQIKRQTNSYKNFKTKKSISGKNSKKRRNRSKENLDHNTSLIGHENISKFNMSRTTIKKVKNLDYSLERKIENIQNVSLDKILKLNEKNNIKEEKKKNTQNILPVLINVGIKPLNKLEPNKNEMENYLNSEANQLFFSESKENSGKIEKLSNYSNMVSNLNSKLNNNSRILYESKVNSVNYSEQENKIIENLQISKINSNKRNENFLLSMKYNGQDSNTNNKLVNHIISRKSKESEESLDQMNISVKKENSLINLKNQLNKKMTFDNGKETMKLNSHLKNSKIHKLENNSIESKYIYNSFDPNNLKNNNLIQIEKNNDSNIKMKKDINDDNCLIHNSVTNKITELFKERKKNLESSNIENEIIKNNLINNKNLENYDNNPINNSPKIISKKSETDLKRNRTHLIKKIKNKNVKLNMLLRLKMFFEYCFSCVLKENKFSEKIYLQEDLINNLLSVDNLIKNIFELRFLKNLLLTKEMNSKVETIYDNILIDNQKIVDMRNFIIFGKLNNISDLLCNNDDNKKNEWINKCINECHVIM